MRMLGRKFVPGFRVQVTDDDVDDDDVAGGVVEDVAATTNGFGPRAFAGAGTEEGQATTLVEAREVPEQRVIRVGQRAVVAVASDDDDDDSDDDDEDDEVEEEEEYESFTRLNKPTKKNDEEATKLEGIDWESLNYTLKEFNCQEDEITGLDVCEKYVVVQYYIEPAIDVYDRMTFELLFRLEGHEYGGQCLKVNEAKSVLYSASMDCSLKTWDLDKKQLIHSVTDHCDYVQSLAVYQSVDGCDTVATGGKGDKAIFVYSASNQGKLTKRFKLQGHKGWIVSMAFVGSAGDGGPKFLVSGSQDAAIKVWDLEGGGGCVRTLEQCAGLTCMKKSVISGYQDRLFLFGDAEGKLSFLDLGKDLTGGSDDEDDEPDTIHILPNILIGTGKYCRSGKYHDKSVDVCHLTENGYLITASEGSKFVKIWKIQVPTSPAEENDAGDDEKSLLLEDTEVRELQILRDHTDYLSTFCVYGDTVYSSCSDGKIYAHTFPKVDESNVHYDMAFDDQAATASAVCGPVGRTEQSDSDVCRQTQQLLSSKSQEKCTEVCMGPRLCRTGKAGLVRSSSSFQVSFQLKPSVCQVDGKIRLPSFAAKPEVIAEEEDDDDDDDDDDDSQYEEIDESDSEFEIIYVSDDGEEDEESESH